MLSMYYSSLDGWVGGLRERAKDENEVEDLVPPDPPVLLGSTRAEEGHPLVVVVS